jgi:hypothetical protein
LHLIWNHNCPPARAAGLLGYSANRGLENTSWNRALRRKPSRGPVGGSADFSFNLTTTYDRFHNDSPTAANELNYLQSDSFGTTQTAHASFLGNLPTRTLAVTQNFGAPVPHPSRTQTAAQLIATMALPAGYHNVVLSGAETVFDNDILTDTQFLNSILLNGVPTPFPIVGNLEYPSQTSILLIPNLDEAPLTVGFEFDVAVNPRRAGGTIDFYFTFNGEPAASAVPEPATLGNVGPRCAHAPVLSPPPCTEPSLRSATKPRAGRSVISISIESK